MTQRPIEKSARKVSDDAQPGTLLGDGDDERIKEGASGGVVGQREQFLELVDHHQQLAAFGKHLPQRSGETTLAVGQLVEQGGRRPGRDPQQRGLQLVERVPTGNQAGEEPVGRARNPPPPQRREQAGPNHRRLARTRRADHGDEPVLGHGSDQLSRPAARDRRSRPRRPHRKAEVP